MLQLFYKKSAITAKEWETAYQRIEDILSGFPIQLIRLESYDGFSGDLDKFHLDLYLEKGTPEERISFYMDWISFSARCNITFYKQWEKHAANVLEGKEYDEAKPITWTPYIEFKNDGTLPRSNGCAHNGYVDYEGAFTEYIFLAIAVMLENLLPGKIFLIALYQTDETIQKVVEWLEGYFKEDFEYPIYFDKQRLLASFKDEYDNPIDVVCRMEHLYRKQYKRNMAFAISNIGYDPSFTFYAGVLADNGFGTFGFADVLNPWIAATQDLESTLALIGASRKMILPDEDSLQHEKRIEKYDLTQTLKMLLNNFILWTPLQREQLASFYSNKEALETGQEDLWGSIYRITGNRLDICPIYASEEELFEAFMYHDPKNGLVYQQIIESWLKKNASAYDDLKQKLEDAELEHLLKEEADSEEEPESESADRIAVAQNFIKQFKEHEQFFVREAIMLNPTFTQIDETVELIRNAMDRMNEKPESMDFLSEIRSMTKDELIVQMKYRLKKLRMGLTVHHDFEKWIADEEDIIVLQYIFLLLSLKLYNKPQAYARFMILWDRKYWDYRRSEKYSN